MGRLKARVCETVLDPRPSVGPELAKRVHILRTGRRPTHYGRIQPFGRILQNHCQCTLPQTSPHWHAPARALSNGLDIPYAIVSHHSYHHHHQSTRPAPLSSAESKMKWGLARSRPGCARRPREGGRAASEEARSPSIIKYESTATRSTVSVWRAGWDEASADERSNRK